MNGPALQGERRVIGRLVGANRGLALLGGPQREIELRLRLLGDLGGTRIVGLGRRSRRGGVGQYDYGHDHHQNEDSLSHLCPSCSEKTDRD